MKKSRKPAGRLTPVIKWSPRKSSKSPLNESPFNHYKISRYVIGRMAWLYTVARLFVAKLKRRPKSAFPIRLVYGFHCQYRYWYMFRIDRDFLGWALTLASEKPTVYKSLSLSAMAFDGVYATLHRRYRISNLYPWYY